MMMIYTITTASEGRKWHFRNRERAEPEQIPKENDCEELSHSVRVWKK